MSIDAANYSRRRELERRPLADDPGHRPDRRGRGALPPDRAGPRRRAATALRLEYDMTLFSTGRVTVWAYLSPRNDVLAHGGLRYAISIDDEAPQVVNITTATGADDGTMNSQWERNTSDNVNLTSTTFTISTSGVHTLQFWMVDPTIVVQKLRRRYRRAALELPRPAAEPAHRRGSRLMRPFATAYCTMAATDRGERRRRGRRRAEAVVEDMPR